MFTKLETFFAIALALITVDNALLTAYLINPNINFVYVATGFQAAFFLVVVIGAIYFVRNKNKRIIID